ncbi:MAG: capsular biosynthesis protein [Bacteroidales bacterium]|nr:capsular biosynthesis protein [Bacteroidales bacterium]
MGFLGLFKTKCSLEQSGVLNGFNDRHSHILYGVDDGIKTFEESLSVLSYMESVGIKEVWCTPHIMEDVPNSTESLKNRFDELCGLYKGTIKLHLAAEYMIDTLFEERVRMRDLLTMEDDMLLVETSTITPPYNLKGSLNNAMSAGYRPIFAHPERCRFLDMKDCEELVRMGIRLQLNLASLLGFYGEGVRTKAVALLKKGLYFAAGSDCHRERVLREQYSKMELSDDIVKRIKAILQ